MTVADLILILIRGVGSRTVAHLVNTFGSAEAVLSASVDDLVERAELRPDVAKLILSNDVRGAACEQIAYCKRNNIEILAATDANYPALLRETPDRPHVLFVQGNIEALSANTLAMVGTREMTPSGATVCNRLVEGLSQSVDNLCIVSGLAYGVDAASHRAALSHGVNTVAVLASVLPNITPAPHRALANDIIANGGAIVSELHTNIRQNGTYFVARNRIVAGLSYGTLVVESPASGGSLITAECALDYGRTVMAVPGRAFDKNSFGSNLLIKQNKAAMVCSGGDIVYELGWDVTHTEEATLSPTAAPTETINFEGDERVLLEAMGVNEVVEYEVLVGRTGFAPQRIVSLLTGLELCDAVRILPGRKCERII